MLRVLQVTLGTSSGILKILSFLNRIVKTVLGVKHFEILDCVLKNLFNTTSLKLFGFLS